jgi:hypothetical protein
VLGKKDATGHERVQDAQDPECTGKLTLDLEDLSLDGADSLDAASLAEISEDVSSALLQQLVRQTRTWCAWYVDVAAIGQAKAGALLGHDCVERLEKGLALVIQLLSGSARLGHDVEGSLAAFCEGLSTFCQCLVNAAQRDDAAVTSTVHADWRVWVSARVGDLLRRTLRLSCAVAFPRNDPANPVAIAIERILSCVASFHSAGLLVGKQWGLLLALSETVTLLSQRISARLESFEVTDADLGAASTLGISLTLTRRPPVVTKSPVKVVEPPASVRKGNRRASAVNMFGADVTADARTGPVSSPLRSDLGFSSPLQGPAETAAVDPEERKQAALSSHMYAEEAALYFLHENASYIHCIQTGMACLVALQGSIGAGKDGGAGATPQPVVGVVTALVTVSDMVEDLTNALLRGHVLSPELFQVCILIIFCSRDSPHVIFLSFCFPYCTLLR